MKRVFLLDEKIEFIVSEKKLIRMADAYTIRLRAPAAFCLLLLIERQGELVAHSDLCHYGWERFGMNVSPNVLHNTMFYLRKSLSDVGDFDAGLIETIPRRGFVLSAKTRVTRAGVQGDEWSNDTAEEADAHDASDASDAHDDGASDSEADWQAGEAPEHHAGAAPPTGRRRARRYAVGLAALAVLSVILLGVLAVLLFSRSLFPQQYAYAGQLDACDVYQNKLGRHVADMKLSRDLRPFCQQKRYLYVTSYLYSNRVSAITCKSKITLFSEDECISNYYIYRNNEDVYE
ncbi:transcriptional regulator [Pantoea sp. 1.19]|uniref:transcriptional regulator n=1 Tax=Pantoea sp. 1.19 TaxID=1925589 RepID=UPI000948CFD3|nr:winged helix-turn-helix domain-containing protein [Pantoea sp. 1.19]